MHFSDSYLHLKKLKDKTIANRLEKALKTLENEVNNPSFIKFLKQKENSEIPIEELRRIFDINQLEKVIVGIDAILANDLPKDEVDPRIPLIREILTDIKKTADMRKERYGLYNNSRFKVIADLSPKLVPLP
ncbi:hypothetical protein [Legionella israelensis]|uniref:Uncharacterized protein n=1 Tax=Legionella israelensis TaxID=454 RepID=A0A0W0VJD0_9GAMM|nr:hypothetical protein [Legionella israelensis]KTD20215.1 hypothetical protein Lisr_1799 [Legionella israelensis]QBS10433.1 hypothetical protein E4T55_11525 [Legionella israelensis]SCY54924.1 hypothetical protein SAMN02746069_02828 [Legionella israelensis DSM 19235]STX60052.1 Uncharacterised protein [Legionella israelensis]